MFDVISSSRRRFSPLQLSPALWLDASDASTLYDSTTGGSLVLADGVVARWEDKSGNARHATQATLGYRPQRKIGVKNGKDIVRFNGANSLEGFLVSSTQWIFFTVHVITSFTNKQYQRVFSQRFSGSNLDYDQVGHYIPILQNSGSTQFGSFANSGMVGLINSTVNVWETRISKHTGSVITNYRNNVASTDYSHTLGSNGYKYCLGAINATSSSFDNLDGNIAEILAFPTALSTADRQSVESYLNAKWAIY